MTELESESDFRDSVVVSTNAQVILIGASASGKSSWAQRGFPPTGIRAPPGCGFHSANPVAPPSTTRDRRTGRFASCGGGILHVYTRPASQQPGPRARGSEWRCSCGTPSSSPYWYARAQWKSRVSMQCTSCDSRTCRHRRRHLHDSGPPSSREGGLPLRNLASRVPRKRDSVAGHRDASS